jgi:hypothetical protein
MPARGPKTRASAGDARFRIDIDLEHAESEAARIRTWLAGLRSRHDLSRYEYTQHVRVVPASTTHSHPILTLGTRFTETEDHLLATYLHEQMHWYLWLLGGPDHDPVAPFFDELVRRYPKAPTHLPEGARNYEQTYLHLVINWLELKSTSDFIGWDRAVALANTQYGYRWIYKTVIRDWDSLGALYEANGLVPIKPAGDLIVSERRRIRSANPVMERGRGQKAPPQAKKKKAKRAITVRGAPKKRSATKTAKRSRRSRRTPAARGGRSRG